MGELISYEVAAARRHIIKRPRLTRLLDETTARIILLVAPAGYGKTTLAREWLEESGQQGLWYFGGPPSCDVAVLANDLCTVLERVAPGLEHRVRIYLEERTANLEPRLLANLLTGEVHDWPEDFRLVIDDYQAVSDGSDAETFLSALLLDSPLKVLIATRRRPKWASARLLLYGEVRELGQSVLAMTEDEADETLKSRPPAEVSGLMALAEGWPAVIGLAALADDVTDLGDALPLPLHEFLADEIFSALDGRTANALTRLSVCRLITPDVVALLNDGAAPSVIDESLERGLLVRDSLQPVLGMHPLLKAFLERKLRQTPTLLEVVDRLFDYYVGAADWDEAFDLLSRYGRTDLLTRLVSRAYRALLNEGRVHTVSRWLSYADVKVFTDPVLDLVAAELAFRKGLHVQALTHATRAARGLGSSRLSATAWNRAGQSAFFLDRTQDALRHFSSAEETATGASDLRESLWGQFNCLASDRPEEATKIFARLKLLADRSPQTELRLAHAEVSLAMRCAGSLRAPLETLEAAMSVSKRCDDPLVVSAFLHSYCYATVLSADYRRAQELLGQELTLVAEKSFDFAVPHVQHLNAASALGLRQFTKAASALDRADHDASRLGDVHSGMNIAALKIRLNLALGDIDRAIKLTETAWERIPTHSLWGEWQCSAALAFAAAGEHKQAIHHLGRAESVRPTIETRVLAGCVRAILALQGAVEDANGLLLESLEVVDRTGNFDSFIAAYRAWPEFLTAASSIVPMRKVLAEATRKSKDTELVRTFAPRLPSRFGDQRQLTRRELEILDLLSQGLANREIGRLLFITESTVKVHVRHIFEKLGARSRAEAAAIFASRSAAIMPPQQTL